MIRMLEGDSSTRGSAKYGCGGVGSTSEGTSFLVPPRFVAASQHATMFASRHHLLAAPCGLSITQHIPIMERTFDLRKCAYLIAKHQVTVPQPPLGFLHALSAALQPHCSDNC